MPTEQIDFLPDPIEMMENRIDAMCDEQLGAPDGSFICPTCKQTFEYEPIALNARPDSPISCFDCLPEDIKKAYRKFEASP